METKRSGKWRLSPEGQCVLPSFNLFQSKKWIVKLKLVITTKQWMAVKAQIKMTAYVSSLIKKISGMNGYSLRNT